MTAADDNLENPYPGLRPFNAEETHLFFGRDTQTAELLRRLQRSRFLAIVGTSGSGKSSLVRAGLLQGLHGGLMAGGSQWRIVDLRPGTDPIGNLAAALDRPGALRDDGCSAEDSFTDATLRRSGRGLVQAVREARLAPRERVLVLVDQFEELFRAIDADGVNDAQHRQLDDDAVAFVDLLLGAARQDELPIYVALTMRSDFLGECARFRDLPEAISDGQYLIPRLTRDQLREAIAGPAAVHGITLTDRLVDRLLDDLGGNPDQLPILQHALMRTWDLWLQSPQRGAAIDLADYERIGGMAQALSRHADEVLDALDSTAGPAPRRIAECLFKALATIGASGREVRRFASVQSVADIAGVPPAAVIAVVEAFRAPGNSFLMPPVGEPLSAATVLDISHESLIRNWGTVRGWLAEEAESARSYTRLATTAALHAQGDAGLLPGPDLTRALAWREQQRPTAAWAQRYEGDFVQAMDFLDASEAAAAAGRRVEAGRGRTVRVALVLSGLAFVAILLGWVAEESGQRADLVWRTDAALQRLAVTERVARLHDDTRRDGSADPARCTGLLEAVQAVWGAEYLLDITEWLCEPNKSEGIVWLEPFFEFSSLLAERGPGEAEPLIDALDDDIRIPARVLLDNELALETGRLDFVRSKLTLRQLDLVADMAQVFENYRQTGELDTQRCADFLRRTKGHEPGWAHLREIADWLCVTRDDVKLIAYFEISRLVLDGQVETALERLDAELPVRTGEGDDLLHGSVLNLAQTLAELQGPPFQAERRALVRQYKRALQGQAAQQAAGSATLAPQPAGGQAEAAATFTHPIYRAIAARLEAAGPAGPAGLSAADLALLTALDLVETDRGYRQRLADLDERQPPEGLEWVPEAYEQIVRHAAQHESAGVVQLFDLAQHYGASFLILLSWPIWWARRRWQRRQAQPIAPRPSALRRALAAVIDVGIALAVFIAAGGVTSAVLEGWWHVIPDDLAIMLPWLLAVLAGAGYLLLCDALSLRYCRSLGKVVFHLRPVREAGVAQPGVITLWTAARRGALITLLPAVALLGLSFADLDGAEALSMLAGVAVFPLLVLVWLPMAALPQGRTLGDRWSRTRVIDADSAESLRLEAPPRYVDGLPAPGATST